MKKFLKNIIAFSILAVIAGEVVVRMTHAMSDIPQRTIDKYGIQKYYPNQEGYWKGGDHKWTINELGWAGELPSSYNNLITIIGDSFIENFMNPNECHQSAYLEEKMETYNFMEAGRSGVSLIEAMEISKNMDSLQPVKTLVYVNNNDFYESIREVKLMEDITQLNLKDSSIAYGKMKAPGLKKVLYTWKLLYYFYNRFPLFVQSNNTEAVIENKVDEYENQLKSKLEIFQLIDYISNTYNITKTTLVFHPNCNIEIIKKCKTAGFGVIVLDSSKDETSWSFEYDSHWTCYGHERAAQQVANALLK